MKTTVLKSSLAFAIVVAGGFQVFGSGPLQRANVSLAFPQTPPVFGYTLTNAFGGLSFTAPVGIVSPPGETNRLFIIEQGGRIAVITNLASPNRSVFLDISTKIQGGSPTDERGLLGLAFHPDYANNGLFFVFYTGTYSTATPGGTNTLHDIVARYQVSDTNANVAATNETILIAQRDQASNHNAGCLQFGPDGYLYVSLGDEGGGNDSWNNSQRIDLDFFSAILRIDVDKQAGNLAPNPHPSSTTNYLVPMDNPFVGATSFNGTNVNTSSVRTEFWAVGLRNPWRFSFDPVTGYLYCADVGQGAREEIDIIVKGGNYGWAYREGTIAGPKAAPSGFTSIDPIQEYGHVGGQYGGNVVTGGVVYRGVRISQLYGAYVFADYGSGNIWALFHDGTNTVPFQWLTSEGSISAFGVDPRNGDVLMANQGLNTIRRLVYSSSFTGTPLPATLADTGAFTNLTSLAVKDGITPYDLNVPFWSDNAIKTRWFSLPDTNLTMGFSPTNNWQFPTGAAWIKHFELELTNGVPASRKRLETRFIVKNSNGAYGVTYRWDDSTTNATIVPEEGMDETFVIDEGGGILRTQVWHYPSRQECLICHTPVAGHALGFNTPQLNRDFAYAAGATNQIGALNAAGYFNSNATGLHTLRALAHPTNTAASLEYRVRSYLAANCSQCHQPGGTGLGTWDARITTTTPHAGLVNGALTDHLGDTNNRVFAPGSIAHSVLLTRISTPGSVRMPPLDSNVLDTNAIALLAAWITNDLPSFQYFATWQTNHFGSTNAAGSQPDDDPDNDGAKNHLEFLTGTDPGNPLDGWTISASTVGNQARVSFLQISNRAFEVQANMTLTNSSGWTPLDVPGNEPFFSVTNRTALVPDTFSTNDAMFYRVRVYEP